MENTTLIFKEKFCALLSFLRQTREKFELVTEEMDDDHLRVTLRGLAVETSQYEQELSSQMQSLNIRDNYMPSICNCDELLKNIQSIMTAESIKEILETCTKTETYFEKAYRNVLNEYFPYQCLRDILVYQLNGIKCTFMKMKLLNSML